MLKIGNKILVKYVKLLNWLEHTNIKKTDAINTHQKDVPTAKKMEIRNVYHQARPEPPPGFNTYYTRIITGA